jgi:hypothetical protein
MIISVIMLNCTVKKDFNNKSTNGDIFKLCNISVELVF